MYCKFEYNLNHLLGYHLKSLAIAVSGGSDSVALLMLTHRWAVSQNVRLVVMIVNHNLRPEAKLEVEYVMNLAQNLGCDCAIFEWDHQNNYSNLQARARQARYQLMTNLCRQLDILTLLTAHHADDNIETFIMRKERFSGIFGLHIDAINFINNTRILRPLFNIHKNELVKYLLDNKISWFEDESNLSEKYQRNKIRLNLANQDKKMTLALKLELSKVNDTAETMKKLLVEAIAEVVSIYEYGFAKINFNKFAEYDKNIKLQLLNFVLTIISGQNKVPRGHSSELIISSLQEHENFVKTLHGCILYKSSKIFLIYREFGKKKPIDIRLISGNIWDNRFMVTGEFSQLDGTYVTHLTISDYKYLIKNVDLLKLSGRIADLTADNHKMILFTLPVVKNFEKVIALPHICYYDDNVLEGSFKFLFEPSFTSRFTHFC